MGHTGMKYGSLAWLLVFGGTLTTACGGSDKPPPLPLVMTGSSGAGGGRGVGGNAERGDASGDVDGGAGLDGGGGTGLGSGDAGALAPTVKITSPSAATNPSVDPVISTKNNGSNMVTVICDAFPGPGAAAAAIDASMVTIDMLDASGTVVTTKQAGPSQAKKTEFSADFIFTALKSGKVAFRCNARDLSGMQATATIASLVDNGPTINPVSPGADSFHPLTPPIAIDFTVSPALLAKTDDGASVVDVGLQINGKTIVLDKAEDPKKAGHYTLSVDLSDTKLFKTAPDGPIPIAITATNKRGVASTTTYHFGVDSKGPAISVTSPPGNAIIPGNTRLAFTVDDGTGSGVDVDTVTVTLNKDVHHYDATSGLWSQSNEMFTFVMDAIMTTDADVQITAIVDATDKAGNSSKVQATFYVDTTPPIVDLDPPDLQEVRTVSGKGTCSRPFDPLGKAANDSQPDKPTVIRQAALLRTLAWDLGNATPDTSVVRFSGVDQHSVAIYVQGDVNKGILTDTNNDHICDEVDKTLPALTTYPTLPAGVSDYEAGGTPLTTTDAMGKVTQICAAGTDGSGPQPLCPSLPDLTRVIQHEQAGSGTEPVVYSLENMNNGCTPGPEYLENLPGVSSSGWVCLVGRAVDATGNVGVSAPLRLCLWDPKDPEPPCSNMNQPPPSCTRDCTAPPHFLQSEIDPPIDVPHINVPL